MSLITALICIRASVLYVLNKFSIIMWNPLFYCIFYFASFSSTRRRMPSTTKAVNEFNFGSAVYGSEPCVIYLNIHNAGASPTEW